MSLGPRISANAEVAHLHFDSPHDHARTVGNPEVEWVRHSFHTISQRARADDTYGSLTDQAESKGPLYRSLRKSGRDFVEIVERILERDPPHAAKAGLRAHFMGVALMKS
jgi:hypothetical protein